jgi:hypothetical protein
VVRHALQSWLCFAFTYMMEAALLPVLTSQGRKCLCMRFTDIHGPPE